MKNASSNSLTSSTRTPILLALALLAIAFAVASGDASKVASAQIDAPSLTSAPSRCAALPHQALHAAQEAERTALAKIARYPYAPSDGPSALDQWNLAERCYALAGDRTAQANAALRTKHWQARIERDYQDHLVRYRHAVQGERDPEMGREIGFLLAFLADREGPFVNNLRAQQLRLQEVDKEEE